MSHALRNRVIILALLLLLGQLGLVVHATVHDADLSCQLCLSQTHYSKGMPSVKLVVPAVNPGNDLIVSFDTHLVVPTLTRAYFQRAPPFSPHS